MCIRDRSRYIVRPSTVGLIGSPPGVTTALMIAIARITTRRELRRRALVMIPTLARSTSTIGYSITRPNTRQSVVTKPKYSLALAFFVIGVVVAYVILPFASTFLLSFSSPDLQPLITASEYFGFVTVSYT